MLCANAGSFRVRCPLRLREGGEEERETERISEEEGGGGAKEGRGRGVRPEGSRLQHISALFALHCLSHQPCLLNQGPLSTKTANYDRPSRLSFSLSTSLLLFLSFSLSRFLSHSLSFFHSLSCFLFWVSAHSVKPDLI